MPRTYSPTPKVPSTAPPPIPFAPATASPVVLEGSPEAAAIRVPPSNPPAPTPQQPPWWNKIGLQRLMAAINPLMSLPGLRNLMTWPRPHYERYRRLLTAAPHDPVNTTAAMRLTAALLSVTGRSPSPTDNSVRVPLAALAYNLLTLLTVCIEQDPALFTALTAALTPEPKP